MNLFDEIANDWTLLLIPVIAGVVGWFTNVVAVKMMFYPVEFKGIPPVFGWQGIVPANALRLANTGLKLVTSKLLKVPELFEDFDSTGFIDDNGKDFGPLVKQVIEDKASEHFPQMWSALSPQIKAQVFAMAEAEVKKVSAQVMDDAANNIEKLLDVEQVVTDAVMADKELMNRVFLKVGASEFIFIERSGLYFGFLFGLVQLLVWIFYPASWVLPFFGFLVGWATNWLALKLIFEPREPRKVGPLTFQGLFHRRQKDIAREFADIVSRRVFSGDNLYNELAKGESRTQLLAMVKARAEVMINTYRSNPMAAGMVTDELVAQLETDLLREVETTMFAPKGIIYAFTDKSDEIREKLMDRMSVMDPEGFEDVLRPAFKQDEWKLILAGAVLGLAAGFIQLFALFADRLG